MDTADATDLVAIRLSEHRLCNRFYSRKDLYHDGDIINHNGTFEDCSHKFTLWTFRSLECTCH